MVSDKVNFDVSDSYEDGNYKSNFARSMAVNSQYRESKSLDTTQLQNSDNASDSKGNFIEKPLKSIELPAVRLRKDPQKMEDGQRFLYGSNNSSRRTSLCFNRKPEPVENFILQSQIDTLQWQLKETESSREMYRAVMKQIVIFLERAHRSLELLGSRMNNQQRVPRTQSEYHMNSSINESINESTIMESSNLSGSDLSSQREISWRRLKKPDPSPEEVPPVKLSQEAFRLLRTAQSLLSTHEPDLARVSSNSEEDLNFLAQLAKEFPPTELKPQRTTSFSLCPKLLTPEKDIKMSTIFNRKLSLQLNDNLRRNSFLKDVSSKLNLSNESSRSSVAESDCILSSTLLDDNRSIKSLGKFKYEKSSSPPVSSVSSAEDESGFSSMNSFQEVGLPILPNDDTKDGLLKTILQNNTFAENCHNDFFRQDTSEQMNLWEMPNVIHKRWSSTPVESPDKPSMKVLWV